ncbi:NAD(P)/FAD-dependent oxidoreductase [Pseudoalteromonas luteoviolacea]|uniref:NAD(P)/FAD-dependent oxidoreductase n=1 Tax=Pseudoalteromonas luteoviolacea TaxID=43657 RepID=UPI00114D5CAF|nr:FAD-dependent oxidoreductase [Pseudoalteromonas luteoviolacea]TQF71198.1 FAD-binding oxidoreductase [Pseudoalteromonas luteoviolacea]
MEKNNKIAVIGAGIVGLCNALQLQQQGYQVTLFDKHGIGEQCSKGNAGHFATEQVFPLADKSLLPKLPKMLLDRLSPLRIDWRYFTKAMPWLMRFCYNMLNSKYQRHTQALKTLNKDAINAYARLLGNSFEEHVTLRGSLLTFEHGNMEEIRKLQNKFLNEGVKVDILNQEEIQALEPQLSIRIKYALLFTEVGHTADPLQLSLCVYNKFVASGGQFVQQQVTDITSSNQSWKLSTQQTEHDQFDKVILCTGAWSKRLCKQLGYKVPIEAERGYHNMLTAHALSRPVASADRQFIMTPMSTGLRLAGTVEFAGLETPPMYERAACLLEHAKSMLKDFEDVQQGEHWMGPRPSLPDSLPVICEAPDHPNVIFSFGHQHLGLTQAAISSELVANLVAKQPSAFDISPYSIARFQ